MPHTSSSPSPSGDSALIWRRMFHLILEGDPPTRRPLVIFAGFCYPPVPAAVAMEFKIGNIFVLPSRSLHASKSPSVPLPKIEEAIGSILIHANGAVTVKSLRGSLSILSQDRVLLAALSNRDSVTIPSVTVKNPSRVMVAQAAETAREVEDKEKRREEAWWWIGGGLAAAGVAAGIGIAVYHEHHEHKHRIPICR